MKVEIISKGENEATFLIKGVPLAFVNALRRAIISEVPVLAIEDVYFYENSSSMWDEYVAHRLGLIPLKAEPGTYNEDTEVRFYLEAEGPKTVYSGDLQPEDAGVSVADPEIPIITLAERQRLRLEAVARTGTAKDHAKWQAGLATFHPVVRVEIKDEDTFKELLPDIDPAEFQKQNESPTGVDMAIYNLVDEALEKHPGFAEIRKKDDVFVFYVESYGNMPVGDLVELAVKDLVRRLEVFMVKVGEKE